MRILRVARQRRNYAKITTLMQDTLPLTIGAVEALAEFNKPRRYTTYKEAGLIFRTLTTTTSPHHPEGLQRPYRSIPPDDMFPTAWRRYAVGIQEALTAGHGQPN